MPAFARTVTRKHVHGNDRRASAMSGFAGQGDGRGSRRRVLHKPAGAQKSSKADSVSLCQLSDPGHRGRGGACAEDDNAGYTGGGSRVTVIVRTSRSACSAVPGSPGSPGSPGLSSASPVAGPGSAVPAAVRRRSQTILPAWCPGLPAGEVARSSWRRSQCCGVGCGLRRRCRAPGTGLVHTGAFWSWPAGRCGLSLQRRWAGIRIRRRVSIRSFLIRV